VNLKKQQNNILIKYLLKMDIHQFENTFISFKQHYIDTLNEKNSVNDFINKENTELKQKVKLYENELKNYKMKEKEFLIKIY